MKKGKEKAQPSTIFVQVTDSFYLGNWKAKLILKLSLAALSLSYFP